jgi:hypothetical protein
MKIETKTKEVNCFYCGKTVTVNLIPFGGGHVGVCPCGYVAYNGV